MKQDNILAEEESSGSSNKAPIAVREIPERPDENSSLSQNTVQEDTGIIDDGNKEDIISGIKDMAVAMNTSPDTFTRSSPVITARTIQPEKREPIPAAKAYKSIEPPSPLPGDTISSVTVNTITAAASVSAREETIYTTDFPDTNRYFYIADITGSYPYESGIEHDFQSNVNPDPLIEEFSEKGRTDLRKGIDNMKIETNYVSYLPPEPAIGEKGFDRYIRENIRYPEPVTDTIILYPSVALKFLVHKNGVIDSIRVIRSPAKRFSAEAVRLIESGPSWKPAEEDGRMIDEEVTVVIEFRK
jgi:protein TonB